MTTAGPNSCGTGADDGAAGNVAWSNPGNVTVDDAAYATCVLTGNNSHLLQAKNFGFTIPAGANIDSIQFDVDAKVSAGSTLAVAGLVLAGVSQTRTDFFAASFTTTQAYKTVGPSLFAQTPSASDVNDVGFGACIQVLSFTGTVSIDHVQATVAYTILTAAGPVQQKVVASARRAGDFFFNNAQRLIGFDTILGAPGQAPDYDLPAARPPGRSANTNRWHGMSTVLLYPPPQSVYGEPGQAPTYDLPAARPLRPPAAVVRMWADDASRLIGQEAFYGGFGQVPTHNLRQANPIPVHPAASKFWWDDASRLLGLDVMYGAAGMVPARDLPRAKLPNPPIAHRSWYTEPIQTLIPSSYGTTEYVTIDSIFPLYYRRVSLYPYNRSIWLPEYRATYHLRD